MGIDTVIRIKDVIIEKISANDKELSHIFGISKDQAARYRREIKNHPSQRKVLTNGGALVKIKGFADYLDYRKTPEWQREKDKFEAMKKTRKREKKHETI